MHAASLQTFSAVGVLAAAAAELVTAAEPEPAPAPELESVFSAVGNHSGSGRGLVLDSGFAGIQERGYDWNWSQIGVSGRGEEVSGFDHYHSFVEQQWASGVFPYHSHSHEI